MTGHDSLSSARFTAVLGVTAVIFFLILIPFELIPEIPVDIDSKPFFVPLAICALLPAGRTGLAVGLGVALGEGLRDLMEGYELDDPIGFFGYVAGFWAASGIFAVAPFNKLGLVIGSFICALVQSALEASSFLLFGAQALPIAIESAIGNTISHGLVWGAIPLLFIVPVLHGKFEFYLGFRPRGLPPPEPMPAGPPAGAPGEDALAGLEGYSFRPPGAQQPCLKNVSLGIAPGEVIGVAADDRDSAQALALAMAGWIPGATGGESAGLAHPPKRATLVAAPASRLLTQPRPMQEVKLAVPHEGVSEEEITSRAHEALVRAGLPDTKIEVYNWSLEPVDQWRVLAAAALVSGADLLIIDGVPKALGDEADELVEQLIAATGPHGAVILIDRDADRLARFCERIIALREGEIAATMKTDKASPSTDMAAFLEEGPCEWPDSAHTQAETTGPTVVPTLQKHKTGWWQRRDPRVKWALFLLLIVMIYVVPDWRWMLAMLLAGIVMTATARPAPGWLAIALLVQIPNVAGMVLLPLLTGGGDHGAELAFGLRLSLGWIAAILFGISLLSSMEIPDMVAGLRGIGLPRSFAFMVGYAFVLIYLSLADFSQTVRSMRDGARPLSLWRPLDFARFLSTLIIPAVITVARRGGAMALAVEARGSAQREIPTGHLKLDPWDTLLAISAVLVLAIALLARGPGLPVPF